MESFNALVRSNLTRSTIVLMLVLMIGSEGKSQSTKKRDFQAIEIRIASGNGKQITIERFEVKNSGRCPAIVLVHGLDGLDQTGDLYRSVAKRLMAKNYHVFLVHYFESTGTTSKESVNMMPHFQKVINGQPLSDDKRKRMKYLADTWKITIRNAITWCQMQSNVNKDRVAVIGFSMGAILTMQLVNEEEIRVASMVELFGCMPPNEQIRSKHFPPMLIIHGETDQVVPVEHAKTLESSLRKGGHRVKSKIYQVGHMFSSNGKIDMFSACLAEIHVHNFLGHHLNQGCDSMLALER